MNSVILAFDTTMSNCSVSLLYKKKITNIHKQCKNNHSEYILPMIKQILDSNGITLKKIDTIAFSKGPGTFSGTRISISIAQGIALGINCSLIALPTILIMAEQAWMTYQCEKILALITINKEYIYWVQYVRNKKNCWTQVFKEQVIHISYTIKHIILLKEKWVIIGNGWNKLPSSVLKKNIITNIFFPNSEYIIHLINSNSCYQKQTKINSIIPIYLSKTMLKNYTIIDQPY